MLRTRNGVVALLGTWERSTGVDSSGERDGVIEMAGRAVSSTAGRLNLKPTSRWQSQLSPRFDPEPPCQHRFPTHFQTMTTADGSVSGTCPADATVFCDIQLHVHHLRRHCVHDCTWGPRSSPAPWNRAQSLSVHARQHAALTGSSSVCGLGRRMGRGVPGHARPAASLPLPFLRPVPLRNFPAARRRAATASTAAVRRRHGARPQGCAWPSLKCCLPLLLRRPGGRGTVWQLWWGPLRGPRSPSLATARPLHGSCPHNPKFVHCSEQRVPS